MYGLGGYGGTIDKSERDTVKIDVQYEQDNKGDNMLEELKTKVEELLGKSQEVQAAVQTAVDAAATPSVDAAIVSAFVAALEAQGYTVTKSGTPSQN